jgi:hypothetical protein
MMRLIRRIALALVVLVAYMVAGLGASYRLGRRFRATRGSRGTNTPGDLGIGNRLADGNFP